MTTLGKGHGIFKLEDSDHNVGSLFSFDDVFDILEIDRITREEFRQRCIDLCIVNNNALIDEKDLYKHFSCLKKMYSTKPLFTHVSLDECVLKALLSRALKGAEISQQVKQRISGSPQPKVIDFRVQYDNQVVFIEFDGPSHYSNQYKSELPNPLDRKKRIEDATGSKCILWPFWIQRCEKNIRSIFDSSEKGLGALWSTNYFFGSFSIDKPSSVIIEETKQFNALREDGIGYFYGGDNEGRTMPVHPIISKILSGKKSFKELIPKDVTTDFEYWLPYSLWNIL